MKEDLQPAILVDLDNTLSLIGDRNPYDPNEAGYDKLCHPVFRLIKKYEKDGYVVLIVADREDRFFEATDWWIQSHGVHCGGLVMRDNDDPQPEVSFKMRAYNQYIKNKFEVELVLDDDTKSCKMWRSLGLTCFQVANDDF